LFFLIELLIEFHNTPFIKSNKRHKEEFNEMFNKKIIEERQ